MDGGRHGERSEEQIQLTGHHPLDEGLVVLVGGYREGAAIVLNGLDLSRAVLRPVVGLSVALQETM